MPVEFRPAADRSVPEPRPDPHESTVGSLISLLRRENDQSDARMTAAFDKHSMAEIFTAVLESHDRRPKGGKLGRTLASYLVAGLTVVGGAVYGYASNLVDKNELTETVTPIAQKIDSAEEVLKEQGEKLDTLATKIDTVTQQSAKDDEIAKAQTLVDAHQREFDRGWRGWEDGSRGSQVPQRSAEFIRAQAGLDELRQRP